jgi:F420-non-reducing hydrogenase iron-sulfur subunit
MAEDYEPRIVAFLCKWCSSAGSDLAGVSRMEYPPNVVPIQVMCSGSVSPLYIFSAFNKGADGVLVSGCHPGDCHYSTQNYKAMRRYHLMQRVLTQLGIEPGRLKLLWASAAEGAIFAREINKFVEEVRALGPLNWNANNGHPTADHQPSSVVEGQPSTEEVPA